MDELLITTITEPHQELTNLLLVLGICTFLYQIVRMKQSSMKSFWGTTSSLVVNSTLGRCEDGNISSSDFDSNPDPIHNDLQFPTQKDVEPSIQNIIEKVFSDERFDLSFPSEDRHKVIFCLT